MANGNGTCMDGETAHGGEPAPANPFTSLRPHFGMLLGVEDLEVLQGYARGKMRLHNAWLHGRGVVWGLGVRFDARTGGTVLAVDPGLAMDGAGRELYLARTACLDVGQWYDKNKDDPTFQFADTPEGGKRFSVAVVACFRACADRPVPAISTSCEGTGADSAFSRIEETVELLLKPIPVLAPARPYPRLRVLFQIDPDVPELDAVRILRQTIQNMAAADQPAAFLQALREQAALDEVEWQPQDDDGRRSLYPEDPGCVLLAEIVDIVVQPATVAGGRSLLVEPPPTPNVKVRPTLVPTSTIQELLCGPLFTGTGGGGGGGGSPPPAPPDAGGPRVDPTSVVLDTKKVTFKTSIALAEPSVAPEAFSLTLFDEDGWSELGLRKVSFDAATSTVTLDLKEKLEAGLVRLVVKGTGPRPILGSANNVPLAGATADPPATATDGRDFVFMQERT